MELSHFIGGEAEVRVSVITKRLVPISPSLSCFQLHDSSLSGMELEVDWSPVLGSLAPPSVMASGVAGLCHHRMGHSDGRAQARLPFLGNHYPLHYYSHAVGLSPEINLRRPRCESPHENCAGRATFRPSGIAVARLGAPQMLPSSMCAYATSSQDTEWLCLH